MPQSRTPPEALDALRERLRATQEAAQRLADEAAAGAGRVPPAGWDVPGRADDANAELVRQLLIFVRAVLDWWIERIEPGPRGDDRPVEDIPIT